MAYHEANCPHCNAELLVTVSPTMGGVVQENVGISLVNPPVNATEVQATPAAQAHAEEVGVDLTQVEGTGKEGTITKADVAAVAAQSDPGDETTAEAEPAAAPAEEATQ